jgi:hypothetical protein
MTAKGRKEKRMTQEEIEHLFTYHPPAKFSKGKRDKYVTLATGEVRCNNAVREAMISVGEVDDVLTVFGRVTAAMKAFAYLINDLCPDNADKSAALRCVRIAHMGANELVVLVDQAKGAEGAKRAKIDDHVYTTFTIVEAELSKARWQANASIDCQIMWGALEHA